MSKKNIRTEQRDVRVDGRVYTITTQLDVTEIEVEEKRVAAAEKALEATKQQRNSAVEAHAKAQDAYATGGAKDKDWAAVTAAAERIEQAEVVERVSERALKEARQELNRVRVVAKQKRLAEIETWMRDRGPDHTDHPSVQKYFQALQVMDEAANALAEYHAEHHTLYVEGKAIAEQSGRAEVYLPSLSPGVLKMLVDKVAAREVPQKTKPAAREFRGTRPGLV